MRWSKHPSPRNDAMAICDSVSCTGCAACFNACGNGAISMISDDEGFLRPVIDPSRCVHCGKCQKVCPQLNPQPRPQAVKTAFACWHKDDDIRNKSSSGGAFTAIAEVVVSRGGVVYGAAFDTSLRVRHVGCESVAGLSCFRRSKYLQSETGHVFAEVRDMLSKGRCVLFSGTPCQVDGLYAYLGHRHEGRLYTVDFACHGVNSPKVFSDYVAWLGVKHGSLVRSLEFRNKDQGWSLHEVVVTFQDGSVLRQRPYGNPYFNGFLKHLFLRPSCSLCRYASLAHPADITLADYWGYKGYSEIDRDDNRGVSAVIVNTSNGQGLFAAAAKSMEVFYRQPEDIADKNAALRLPSQASCDREVFWRDYARFSFSDALIEKYMTTCPDETPPDRRKPKPRRFKPFVKRVLKKLLGARVCRLTRRVVEAVKHIGKRTVRFFRLYVVDRLELFFFVKANRCIFVFVSPGHTNLGDNAQTLCIREFLEKYYPGRKIRFFTNSYINATKLSIIPYVKRISKPDDLVFLHSGYRMTDVWPDSEEMHRLVVETFVDRPVVSFPQTIFYETDEARKEAERVFNAHPDNTIMCRDAISYRTAQDMFPKCRLLLQPDIVTSKIGQYHFNEHRSGILVCKRNDKESKYSSQAFSRIVTELSRLDSVTVADTFANDSWKVMHQDLRGYLERVWRKYASYRLVVTDRYHGTIFSLVAETPVIVFPSTDHKVRSGVDWFPASFAEYVKFVDDVTKIPEEAKKMMAVGSRLPLPPYFLERYYNDELFRKISSPRQPQTGKGGQ